MYPNYIPNYMNGSNFGNGFGRVNPNDRLVGGFAFPFLLGGVTGAALAPAFWRPPYSPYYNRPPYPYYGPYYR